MINQSKVNIVTTIGQSEASIQANQKPVLCFYPYLDNQLVAAVNGSACSQLGKQEEKEMLGLPVNQLEISIQVT